MTVVVLAAGNATRMKHLAPRGCKALAAPGGRTMIEWTRQATGENPLVVCKSEHVELIGTDASTVVCDELGGPVRALKEALPYVDIHGPLTVLYSDTWVPALPQGEFCGVAAADGGRFWDVVEDGLAAYRYVDSDEAALVCIGAYRFHHIPRLRRCVGFALASVGPAASMAEVVNHYRMPFRTVTGWQDIGDEPAFGRFRDPDQ